MNVKVTRLTSKELVDRVTSYTVHREVHPNYRKLLHAGHSVIRADLYLIELNDVPIEQRDHLTRHKVGIEFWCQTHRDDRTGETPMTVTYETPTNMAVICNAETLMNLAHKRLCFMSHHKTVELVNMIKAEVAKINPDLADEMVPMCYYRKHCPELKSCGFYENLVIEPLIKIVFDGTLDEEYRKENLRRFFK